MHHAFSHVAFMEPVSFDSPPAYQGSRLLMTRGHDVVMTTDAFYVGDLAKDLLELFPVDHGAGTLRRQTARYHAVAKHRPVAKRRRRNRNRKRSDKEKKVESEKRKIKQDKSKDRRNNCLQHELLLRQSICACIRWCAEAMGFSAGASIAPLLPWELREIMAKADAAMLAYRGFSGQKTLIKQLNELPTWW